MNAPSWIADGTAGNFPQLVLENSARGPVLVYYWSPRAGPCQMLLPRLTQLAAEFGGRFLLVLLNTDEHGPLARSHGVLSVPTVKLYRNGAAVDTLHGAESEDALRRFIGRHLPEPALDLAKRLVLQDRLAEAETLLQSLPEAVRAQPELRQLAVHVAILSAARSAPEVAELDTRLVADPADLETRFQRAARALTENDFEAALQQLLEIVQRDRGFRNGIGHEALLTLFAMLGEEHELVRRFRPLLPS